MTPEWQMQTVFTEFSKSDEFEIYPFFSNPHDFETYASATLDQYSHTQVCVKNRPRNFPSLAVTLPFPQNEWKTLLSGVTISIL